MATQEEIRVGSIVYCGEAPQGRTGIVLDTTRRSTFSRTADIYWLKERLRGWAYIYYLDVLVY